MPRVAVGASKPLARRTANHQMSSAVGLRSLFNLLECLGRPKVDRVKVARRQVALPPNGA